MLPAHMFSILSTLYIKLNYFSGCSVEHNQLTKQHILSNDSHKTMSVYDMIDRYLTLTLDEFDAMPEELLPTEDEYITSMRLIKCLVVSCDDTEYLCSNTLRRLMTRDEWVWALMFREWYSRKEATDELRKFVFHCFTDMVESGSEVDLDFYLTTEPKDQISEGMLPNNEENHERFMKTYGTVRVLYSQIYEMEMM